MHGLKVEIKDQKINQINSNTVIVVYTHIEKLDIATNLNMLISLKSYCTCIAQKNSRRNVNCRLGMTLGFLFRLFFILGLFSNKREFFRNFFRKFSFHGIVCSTNMSIYNIGW